MPTPQTNGFGAPRSLRVLLCDDCCCGTERKHPGVDHAAIRERLTRAAESAGGRGRSVGCVGVCERSNVVVVKTPASGTLWVGAVLGEPIVSALETWIAGGGALPVPAVISSHVFDRPLAADDEHLAELIDEPDNESIPDAVPVHLSRVQ